MKQKSSLSYGCSGSPNRSLLVRSSGMNWATRFSATSYAMDIDEGGRESEGERERERGRGRECVRKREGESKGTRHVAEDLVKTYHRLGALSRIRPGSRPSLALFLQSDTLGHCAEWLGN